MPSTEDTVSLNNGGRGSEPSISVSPMPHTGPGADSGLRKEELWNH